MAGATARLLKNPFDALTDGRGFSTKDHGVQVALHSDAVAETGPGLVQLDMKIEPDNISSGIPHVLEQHGRPGPKVDHRHTRGNVSNHHTRIGHNVLAIV